jgi:hypothetical protein
MPLSMNNTTLTFNDASTQTTSAVTAVNVGTGISSTGGKTPTLTNSGVTSIVAGTGISISGGTGAVTITNSQPGAVSSVNGATGAVTTTNFDSIGGTGIFMMGTNTNVAYNGTTAGSNLRYNYATVSSANARTPFLGRNNGASYSAGGTSISGTWRKLSTGDSYYDDGCGVFIWNVHFYVRIS